MADLTPFGIAVRKLRLDRAMRLLDMAKAADRSVAFLSAVETGRKPIPDGFVAHLGRSLLLDADEIRALRVAADQTRKEVRVESLSHEDRELVAAFARRLDDVPEHIKQALRKVVLKSVDEETPFKRSRRGMYVPPMSTRTLRGVAEQIRDIFVEPGQVEFPIMDVLEFRFSQLVPDFVFDVQDREAMGHDEGRVLAGSNTLILRQDIYEGAWNGVGRDRFTACHELAHYVLHRQVGFSRTRDDSDKIYCDAEWQADTFAGTLLMSPRHLRALSGPDAAAEACRMTPAAARVMWSKYQSEGLVH
jgi:hypothetical protein